MGATGALEEHFTLPGEGRQSFAGECMRVPVGKVGRTSRARRAEHNGVGLHDVWGTCRQFPMAEVCVA